MSVCSIAGCGKKVDARGLCGTHYMQRRRAGLVPIGTRAVASLEDRFWRFVKKTSGCWTWGGSLKGYNGYGRIGEGGKGGKYLLAHRVSYEIHHGPIPDGMVVMHSCDNPSCVNPTHLRVGTTAENVKEAYEKRRKVSPFKKGEEHHMAVLDSEKVRYIRSNPQLSLAKLAARFGCSPSAIKCVRDRRTWTDID